MESHLEARLWNDAFVMAQDELGIAQGTIKATEQPKPIVEKPTCLLSFPILEANEFRLKTKPCSTVLANC